MCGVSIIKTNKSSFEFNAGEGGIGGPGYALWYACGYQYPQAYQLNCEVLLQQLCIIKSYRVTL